MTLKCMPLRIALCIHVFPALLLPAQERAAASASEKSWCSELQKRALMTAASGRLEDAETTLLATLSQAPSRPENDCAGRGFASLAILMALSGKMSDAGQLAARSLTILEPVYSEHDPVLIRPLETLSNSFLEDGQITKAREAYRRMTLIQAERPEDRALIRFTAGTVLHVEKNFSAAVAEYLAAWQDFKEARQENTAEAATVLKSLASAYIEERRFEEAEQSLDSALAILDVANDAAPADRIALYRIRAALFARQRDWDCAAEDFETAISMVKQQAHVEPAAYVSLLAGYGYVLHKAHRNRDARVIETQVALLRSQLPVRATVDLGELQTHSKR